MSLHPPLLDQGRRWILALLIGNGLAQAALAIVLVLIVKILFDQHLSGKSAAMTPDLLWNGMGLLCCALGLALARGRALVDAERLAQNYLTQLRNLFFAKLLTLSPRALQHRSHGGLMLRFLGDLGALRLWIALGIARATVAAVMVLSALAALCWISPEIAAFIATLGGAAALAAGVAGRRLELQTRAARRVIARTAARLSERIRAMVVIQLHDQSAREATGFDRQATRLADASVARARARGSVRTVSEACANLAAVGVLLAGVILVAGGAATAGEVAAALSIVGLLARPLRDLGRAFEFWQGARISLEKIDDFLKLPSSLVDASEATPATPGQGEVSLRQATLAGAFADVTARLAPASRVALIGPNGSGKSSLLLSIARLNELDCGQIAIDGQDIRSLTLSSLREMVCLVSPDLHLFRGTIESNLRYGNRQASAAEMQRVRTLCDIAALEEPLNAQNPLRLREGGVNLSAGQRARLCLARALLRNPRILLLDEMDANLDEKSAQLLDQVIQNFAGTVIFVTHRLERAARADIVLYMEAGRLTDCGPPAQVLAPAGPASRSTQTVQFASIHQRRSARA